MAAPTAAVIDDLARRYTAAKEAEDGAKALAKIHTEAVERLKAELLQMVAAYGFQSSPASRRLQGVHATVTATTGTTTNVVPTAVDKLRGELDAAELTEVSGMLFTKHVSYQLVQTPADVLKRVTLPTRMRNKLQKLIALCFEQKTKAPSLKVELVEATIAA